MAIKRHLIYIDGKESSGRISSCKKYANSYRISFKGNVKSYNFSSSRVRLVTSAISENTANNIFTYLSKIASAVGLKSEDGVNSLAQSYQAISFIPNNCVLSHYLNRNIPPKNAAIAEPIGIYPFGFNISQKDAVDTAFSNPLSVIEGPPGTGKTQTILNIIANAVMNNQSVAVVSSNNSATRNVYEKLEKNGVAFISALLGNHQNKQDFIEGQLDVPDLSEFALKRRRTKKMTKRALTLFSKLSDKLAKKNELALLNQELANLKSEYLHFSKDFEGQVDLSTYFKNRISADKLLEMWLTIEKQAKKRDSMGLFSRLAFYVKYGISDKRFYRYTFSQMILSCQFKYYTKYIAELEHKQNNLEASLSSFSFEATMETYTKLSMQLFKAALHRRYKHHKRRAYAINELWSKSEAFIQDYPVIMSTTYSLRRSLSDEISYDYLIIDESSQVDLATGALALSCAKRAVVVGDLKQLPNVVDSYMQKKTDLIFNESNLPEAYRYANNSLLSSIVKLFPNVPKTLLREHYRCHPKIIEFCNKKFYNNQLIVHTKPTSNRQALLVYKTPPGNHARERMNQRQIDVIKQEIIPNEKLEKVDLGIVTPYRNQTNALQKAFPTQVKADTVDKFQGRENEVIILSTVDNQISDFTDNPNRLNVAVSRAIKQLILVVNGNEERKDNNITDLVRFIEYNNFTLKQSKLSSIFDCLYKGLEDKRARIIEKAGRVAEFDSENLMYALIKHVLSYDDFTKYGVVLHFSVRNLIKDYSKLNEQETQYAQHPLTHLDFLIYNKLSKTPVLAIEVDGYAYHKQGSRQSERDLLKDKVLEKCHLPLLRFATNGSNEKERLINQLRAIQAL